MLYEQFTMGSKIVTRKRVVTGTDIDNFAVMTGAVNPLFLKDEVGVEVGYKSRIAPGALTLSLSIGLQYGSGLFDHLIAFKGIDKLSFLAPVHPGDIIWCEAEVIDRKEIRGERGLVVQKWVVRNQDQESVLEAETTFIYRKE